MPIVIPTHVGYCFYNIWNGDITTCFPRVALFGGHSLHIQSRYHVVVTRSWANVVVSVYFTQSNAYHMLRQQLLLYNSTAAASEYTWGMGRSVEHEPNFFLL